MHEVEGHIALEAAVPAGDPPPTLPPLPALRTEHAFLFSGDSREYFRIWIVNLALSIVTLGVYSAWAKVRTQRYFYSHTRLADAPFEYLAQPIPILKGRLIAVSIFGSYLLAGQFFPILQIVLALLIGLATPWLVVRGLMFRARYSSWRGLNFRFVADYGEAIRYFFLMYILVPFSLGLIYPYIKALQKKFVVDHHRYGGKWFQLKLEAGAFYPPYLIAIALGIGWVFLVSMCAGMLMAGSLEDGDTPGEWIGYAIVGLIYSGYFLLWIFVSTKVSNLVYNHVDIEGHRFRSSFRVRDMLGLYVVNSLAILVSAGMLIPWAMVRLARYRAQHLALIANGDLDRFSTEAARDENATGAEMDGFFDVDIGL